MLILHDNTEKWNMVQYTQGGYNVPVINGITEFLNILSCLPAFSAHAATTSTVVGGLVYSGVVVYSPSLSTIPSITELGNTWNVYSSNTDIPVNVYNGITDFMNQNLTVAQGFYGKLSVVQSTNLDNANVQAFFWYKDLASAHNTHNVDDQLTATTWTIKSFQEDQASDIANIFVQILDGMGGVRSQCASLASDVYIDYPTVEAYGGALIPGFSKCRTKCCYIRR